MKWISVKDKLPKINEKVIFYSLLNFICIGYIIPEENRGKDSNNVEFFWFVDMSENESFLEKDVTHWMPLPELPI